MRKLIIHSLIVAAVMLGGDWLANEGRETEQLARQLRPGTMLHDAKLRQYQMGATLQQQIYSARPQLVFAGID